jgi:hypothetical protein
MYDVTVLLEEAAQILRRIIEKAEKRAEKKE